MKNRVVMDKAVPTVEMTKQLRRLRREMLSGNTVNSSSTTQPWLKQVFGRDEPLKGSKVIALFLGMHEERLRAAYRAEPLYRKYILRTETGRYWADVYDLMNLIPAALERRARRSKAVRQHAKNGQFV